MAYIKSFQELANGRKTRRLMRRLDWDLYRVIGLLHVWWWWSLDNTRDGVIPKSEDEIEDMMEAIGYQGDRTVLLEALVYAEFLDDQGGAYAIHDWDEYMGDLLDKRRQAAERQRAFRHRHKSEESTDRDVTHNETVTSPLRNKQEQYRAMESNGGGSVTPAVIETTVQAVLEACPGIGNTRSNVLNLQRLFSDFPEAVPRAVVQAKETRSYGERLIASGKPVKSWYGLFRTNFQDMAEGRASPEEPKPPPPVHFYEPTPEDLAYQRRQEQILVSQKERHHG